MPKSSGRIAEVRKALRKLKTPAGRFTGLTWQGALAPDQIVFFKRTDPASLGSVLGVNSNYHHRFELVVVLETGGPGRVDGQTFMLEPGECVLIFPHQFHHWLDVKTDSNLEWLFITFELPNSGGVSSLRNAPRVLGDECLELVQRIVKAYVNPSHGGPDPVEVSYLISRLLLGLIDRPLIPAKRRNIHGTDDSRDVILEKINEYVRSHLAAAPTLADLATATGYSESYLRAVFRGRLGISLGKYIRESRLSEAAKLLQSSELSIAEIAEKSGFESQFIFSRSFKNAYGVAPKVYAKLVREGQLPERVERPEW